MMWINPFQLWADSLAAGTAMARTGMRFGETMAASAEVIDSRSRTIADACRDPIAGDYRELGLMVPEKLEAFWEAHVAAAGDVAAVQVQIIEQWQQLARIAGGGRMPSPAEAKALAARSSRMAKRTTAAAGKALAPVHRRATANARRLRRSRPR